MLLGQLRAVGVSRVFSVIRICTQAAEEIVTKLRGDAASSMKVLPQAAAMLCEYTRSSGSSCSSCMFGICYFLFSRAQVQVDAYNKPL